MTIHARGPLPAGWVLVLERSSRPNALLRDFGQWRHSDPELGAEVITGTFSRYALEGLCGLGFEGRGMIHICVQDAAAAHQALEAAGIKVEGEADAILGSPVPGADEPATMGAMARQIADAGINVRAAYLATNSRVVMVTDDNERLMQLIANM